MIYSVLSHYSQDLIICLTFFSFFREYYLLSRLQDITIYHSYFVTHPRPSLPTPGHYYPSPAIPLIFVDTCPAVFPNTGTCRVPSCSSWHYPRRPCGAPGRFGTLQECTARTNILPSTPPPHCKPNALPPSKIHRSR